MNEKKLYRSTRNSKILGVCGGIAAYFGIDATVVRVITVILALVTSGVPLVVAYLILGAVIPKNTDTGDDFNADGSFNTDTANFNADRNRFNADGSNFNSPSDSGKRSDRNFNPFE